MIRLVFWYHKSERIIYHTREISSIPFSSDLLYTYYPIMPNLLLMWKVMWSLG